MLRILFFETPLFTGATRVTRTVVKKLGRRCVANTVVIRDVESPREEIAEAIRVHKPDVLFCSFASLNPDVITEGKNRGLKVVVRNDYSLVDVDDATRRHVLSTYPLADWVIAQTPEMREELLRVVPGCRVHVMDNPLDEEDLLQKAAAQNPFHDDGNFHFLWVGRRDPIKDLATLQKAFEIVHREAPDTDLTLISDDSNPYRWMKNAGCLVICSRSEASPNVLREALFLGTPVVSTDCSPTVRRLLPEDKISPVGDPLALAGNMLRVIRSEN